MAYNFKSIADVEVVAEPTESANVLIEEDGVIKKAPKTAVGGSGHGNLVFVFDCQDWVNSDIGYKQVLVPEGLYEAIDQMYNNYADINLVVYRIDHDHLYNEVISYVAKYDGEYTVSFGSGYHIVCRPNGSIYTNQWD